MHAILTVHIAQLLALSEDKRDPIAKEYIIVRNHEEGDGYDNREVYTSKIMSFAVHGTIVLHDREAIVRRRGE